jgi:hypothetical protein
MLLSSPGVSASPRPLVRIIQSEEINAYVASAQVCVDVPLVIDPTVEPQTSPLSNVLKVDGQSTYSAQRPDCVTIEGDLATKKSFIEFALRKRPDCQVSINGDTLELSRSCVDTSTFYNRFEGLTYEAVHNYITIYSGLLSFVNEPEMVGVLAHELGHYYMAHGMGHEADYDFFYELKERNSDSKPAPLPDGHPLMELGQKAKDLPSVFHQKIEGQEFESHLFNVIRATSYVIQSNLDGSICMKDQADCLDVCKPMVEHLNNSYDNKLAGLPYYLPETDEARKVYFQYEAEVKACLLKLRSSALLSVVNNQLNYLIYKLKMDTVPAGDADENGLALIRRAELVIKSKVDAVEAEAAALVNEAMERGLGWYTTEQEADDIATEMIHRLGLNPQTFVEFSVKSAEALEKDGSCRQQYEAGFPAPVSLGEFNDLHHKYCFRAYNSQRELDIHAAHFAKYKDYKTPVVQPELSWDEALKSLKLEP